MTSQSVIKAMTNEFRSIRGLIAEARLKKHDVPELIGYSETMSACISVDRRLSAVDVQGERSLNPRWYEMSMPAAMDSQLLLVVKVTTTDSEVTLHTYPIPEDRGEGQALA